MTAYLTVHNRSTVAVHTDQAEALAFAQEYANAVDVPSQATAHILIEAWFGTTVLSTTHVYAKRCEHDHKRVIFGTLDRECLDCGQIFEALV